MDQRPRKVMTMHDDVDRLYVARKEGRRGLTSIEDSVEALIQRLENYIEKHGEGLIIATKNNTDNRRTNQITMNSKQK